MKKEMTFPEFIKGMKRHFGIKTGVQEYVDTLLYSGTKKIKLDIVRFDDWLHEKHGEYENEKSMSMSELIESKHGKNAVDFILSTI